MVLASSSEHAAKSFLLHDRLRSALTQIPAKHLQVRSSTPVRA